MVTTSLAASFVKNKRPRVIALVLGNESSVEYAAPESYQPLILCCVARRLKRSFWSNIQSVSCASEPNSSHRQRLAFLRETGSFFCKCNEGMGMERTVALRNLLLVETALRLPREPKTAEKRNPVKKHDVSEKKTGSVQKDGYFQITHHFLTGFYG